MVCEYIFNILERAKALFGRHTVTVQSILTQKGKKSFADLLGARPAGLLGTKLEAQDPRILRRKLKTYGFSSLRLTDL